MEAAWKISSKLSTTWLTVGSGVDDRGEFQKFLVEFCRGGVTEREWYFE